MDKIIRKFIEKCTERLIFNNKVYKMCRHDKDRFITNLNRIEQHIKEKCAKIVKSFKDDKVEMKDMFGKNYILDKAAKAIIDSKE